MTGSPPFPVTANLRQVAEPSRQDRSRAGASLPNSRPPAAAPAAELTKRGFVVYVDTTRIVVDLSARRLVAYRGGRVVLRAPVAIGALQTPTPTGRFFVNERFVLSDPNGPFGVAALGISAHSTVLHDWVQGGPIALHGTNESATVGDAVSHGCIRLANGDMRRLLAVAPAGTPVLIRR